MPISFACKKCGKKLKAPDSAVGKTSKCPGCGAPVTCPEPVYEAEAIDTGGDLPEILDDDDRDPYGLGGGNPYAVSEPPEGPEKRRPCPMCGEMILAGAVKCRFCGEVFDETVKTGKKKKKKRGGRDEDELTGLDWTIGVLGFVGNLVMAVVFMTQGNPKGTKLLVMSLCADVYWIFAWVVIHSM